MDKTHAPTSPFCTSLATSKERPWTEDEHERFLIALEQFGGGQCSSVKEAWQAIANAVGTRDRSHVVYHARVYFAQLQQLNAHKRQERQYLQTLDQCWSREDDATFENLLAAFSTSSVCYPWDVMACHLPGKRPVDLKERYQKLCHDIAKIESGEHLTIPQQDFARPPELAFMPKATTSDERERGGARMFSPPVLDSVITLTQAEEKLLETAMAQVFVPPEAPADLLAGIASAVAAFTSSNGRRPPQRTHCLFTKDRALQVLNELLQAQQTDPQIVLETLALKLQLVPQPVNVSAGVSFSSKASTKPQTSCLSTLETSTTTPRLCNTFGLLSPSPSNPSPQFKPSNNNDDESMTSNE